MMSNMADMNLGDRMKMYEGMTESSLMPHIPAIARLDGKAFHSFCRGLNRPYDNDLSSLMIHTAMFLAQETNASLAYTQSDEITLAWVHNELQSFFAGRVMKTATVLAGLASSYFNLKCRDMAFSEKAKTIPCFDCRIWNVPNLEEAANVFVWRELDATKNSVSMAAQSVYSHKELMNKNSNEMQEMLFQKGINWNNYPSFFKRGTYIKKITTSRKFTTDEIDRLPKRHEARTNPELIVTRQDFEVMKWEPILSYQDRVEHLFRKG